MTQPDDHAADADPAPRGSWVGVVANPSSGSGVGRRKAEALAGHLRGLGLEAEFAWTPSDRAALVARADADPSCRCLAAVGGDGTVSALVDERPRTPITVLASGTENLAARHFGLGRDPERLARTIATGRVVSVDVGLAHGRRFLLMAGFGFDGDVVTRHHGMRAAAGRVRTALRAAYFEPVLRASVSYRFPPITVRIEDAGAEEVVVGTTVFLFNLPRYALNLPFAPTASQDDGLLDLVVFRDPGPVRAFYYVLRVAARSHLKMPGVAHRRVRKVSLSAPGVVPAQIDGDPAGRLLPDPPTPAGRAMERDPWTVEVVPGALRVLVDASSPAGGPAALAATGRFR